MTAKKDYTKPSMTEHKEVDVKPTRCPKCRSHNTHTYVNGRAGFLYKCDECNHRWSGVIVGRTPRRNPPVPFNKESLKCPACKSTDTVLKNDKHTLAIVHACISCNNLWVAMKNNKKEK